MKKIYIGMLSLEGAEFSLRVSSREIKFEDDKYWYLRLPTDTPEMTKEESLRIGKFNYKDTIEYEEPYNGYRTGSYISFTVDDTIKAKELLNGLKDIANKYHRDIGKSLREIKKIKI